MDLYHVDSTYGSRAFHRYGALYKCTAKQTAALHHDVCNNRQNAVTPESEIQFKRTVMGSKLQGRSEKKGLIMASMSAKGKVQVQATLRHLRK